MASTEDTPPGNPLMNEPSRRGDERPEDLELRFRILSAEYSALIFYLGSTWSVSAARTNLFFVALSAAGVALALISNASHFSREFQVFALALLLLVLLIGIFAMTRMLHAHAETVLHIQSLNRIRHFFTELDPGTKPYFTLPTHDDEAALVGSTRPRPSLWTMTNLPAASMATLVALVNTFVTSAIAGTAYLSLGGNPSAALVWAAAGFAIASVLIWGWVFRELYRIRRSLVVRYPRDD
jgi:hypothetical protein